MTQQRLSYQRCGYGVDQWMENKNVRVETGEILCGVTANNIQLTSPPKGKVGHLGIGLGVDACWNLIYLCLHIQWRRGPNGEEVSISFLGWCIFEELVSSLLICLSAVRAEGNERGRANHLSLRRFKPVATDVLGAENPTMPTGTQMKRDRI